MHDLELGVGLTCFIVSPIGNRLEPVGSPGRSRFEESAVMWEDVLEPACNQFGLSPVRADRIAEMGEIPDQIFRYLRDADVVIADLSHANPNVMYELGLRHSRANKITIQIGEYGLLPFDVTTIRTLQFNRTTAGLIGVRNDLVEAIRVALSGGGSPLRATTIFNETTPLPTADVSADVAKSVAVDPSAPVVAEPGIMDVLVEGEGAIGHIAEVLGEATEEIQLVGTISATSAVAIDAANAANPGFAGRLVVIGELAKDLLTPSERLEELGNDFYADVLQMDAMTDYIVNRFESGDEEIAAGVEYLRSMRGLVNSAEEGAVGITNFRDGSRTLSKMARALDPVAKTLVRAADRFLEGIAIMSQWRPRIDALLEGFAD